MGTKKANVKPTSPKQTKGGVGQNLDGTITVAQRPGIVLTVVLVGIIGLVALGMTLATNLRQPFGSTDANGGGALTQEMLRIGDELQCPICEGQSVAFSNSRLAEEMRLQILEQLEAGADEATIKQYFVDRYGEIVLREPPRVGLNLWLWRVPFLGLFAGLLVLCWMLFQTAKNRQVSQLREAQHLAHNLQELDPEIEALVAQYDRELLES